MKRYNMNRIIYFIVAVLSVIGLTNLGYSATLVRTSSNTIRFSDSYDSTEYIDATGVSTYITTYGSGSVRSHTVGTSFWAAPSHDVASGGGYIYTANEWSAHSKILTEPPFNGNNGGDYRKDVYIQKFNTSGTAQWSQAIRLRSVDESDLYFYRNSERNVNITVDDNGVVFAAWKRRNAAGNYKVFLQCVSNDGSKPWGNEIEVITERSYYGAGIATIGDYVFVLWGDNGDNNIYIRKYNKSDGSLVGGTATVNVAAMAEPYHPKLLAGKDGYLYAVWLNTGSMAVYAQRWNPTTMARVNWGGDTTDKQIDDGSGYSQDSFWYGWTENEVSLDMDSSTNLYVVWSSKNSGQIATWGQSIACTNGVFVKRWNGGSDVCFSPTGLNGDVYCDVAIGSSKAWVSYITHDSGENDRMEIQQFNMGTGVTVGGRIYPSLTHHARIATLGNYVYANGAQVRLKKYDWNGTQLFSSAYFKDRYYMTRFFYTTTKVIPGTVHEATVIQENTTYQTGAFFKYWISPDGGTTIFGPKNITNSTGSISFNSITNLANEFKVYIVGDNNANNAANYIAINDLAVEATKIHLGDVLVGKSPDGSDAKGNLIINDTSSDQFINTYVYNTGTSAASAYFFIKNNGNFVYDMNTFQLSANAGDANWDVQYWLCDSSGNTNTNITALLTGGGWATNISAFTNNEWIIIRAYLTPDISLALNDSYSIDLQVEGMAINNGGATTNYYFHDQATITAVVSGSLPDLIIQSKGESQGYDVRIGTGEGQTNIRIGETNVQRIFYVHLRNAGGNDTIKVTADAESGNWTATYWTNGVNITASITVGGISNTLNTEEWVSNIEVRVTPTSAAAENSSISLGITAESMSDPTKNDKVVAKYIRVRAKTDSVVEDKGYGIFSGTLISSQLHTNFTDNGFTNDYAIFVSNRGSYAMDFEISAVMSNTLNSEWKVICLDGADDITTTITNSAITVSNLAIGATHSYTVRIITPTTHNNGANETMGFYVTAKAEGDYDNSDFSDVVGIEHKTISSRVDSTIDGLSFGTYEAAVSTQDVFKYIYDTTNFAINISNSANSPYRITSTAVTFDFGFDVVYTNGGSDISSDLASGWAVDFTANENRAITVDIAVDTAAIGDTYTATIQSLSAVNASDVDTIRYSVERAVPPDMVIKKGTESDISYRGNNVYGTDPTTINQVVASSYPQGSSSWYQFVYRLGNDRLSVESNSQLAVISTTGWDVKLFRYIGGNKANPDLDNGADWNEITTDITNTGFIKADEVALDYSVYKVEIRADTATNEGDTVNIDIAATGVDTGFKDVARISMSYGMGKPDIVYTGGVNQSTNWNDVYVTTYTEAVATNYGDKSKGSQFDFIIQNDSISNPSSFVVKGTGDVGSWNIKYFDASLIDITVQMISVDGYTTPIISNLSSITLAVVIDASNSQNSLGDYTNIDIKVATEMDELNDFLRIVTIQTDLGQPDFVLGDNANDSYTAIDFPTVGTNVNINWGETLDIPVVLQNDRNLAELIKVYGSFDPPLYWNIKYFTNSIEITSDVSNGFASRPYVGGWTVLIPANSSITLDTKISLASNCTYTPDTIKNFYMYTYSEGRLKRDGVRIRATIVDDGRPDITSASEATWDDWYENLPSSQVADTNTEKGWNNVYYVCLENDRNQNEDFKFSATGASNNWDVAYSYFDGSWNDITGAATNSNYTITVPSLSCVTLAIDGYIDRSENNALGTSFSVDMKLISWMTFATDSARITYTIEDMSEPDLSFTNGLWNDYYETIAVDPSSTTNVEIEMGETKVFYIYIENDSSVRSNEFSLIATPEPDIAKWSVVFEKWTNGGYLNQSWEAKNTNCTNMILPGTNEMYRVSITAKTNMPTNTIFNEDICLISEFGIKKDLGRIALKYVDKGDLDLMFGDDRNGVNYVGEPFLTIQNSNVNLEYGDIARIEVYLSNRRTDSDEVLHIKGGQKSHDDFSLQYYKISGTTTNGFSTTNIVLTVTNIYLDEYENIPMNSEITVLVEMALSSNSALGLGTLQSIDIELISRGTAITDTMTLDYRVADLSKPDIYVKDDPTWSNVIENPALSQISNVYVETGHTNIVEYYIENGRAKNEEFRYYASGNRNHWEINHYADLTGWSNINHLVTNSISPWVKTINGSSRIAMRSVVYIPYDYTNSYTNYVADKLYLVMNMKSWMGFTNDQAKINYVLYDPGEPNIYRTDKGTWSVVAYPLAPPQQVRTTNEISEPSSVIEKGYTNTFELLLTNERGSFDKFNLAANAIRWNTKFFLDEGGGWSNITEFITNDMYLDFDANEGKLLRIDNFAPLDDTNANNTYEAIDVTLCSYKSSTIDTVRLEYKLGDYSKPDIIVNGSFSNQYSYQGQPQPTNIYIEKGEIIDVEIEYFNAAGQGRSYNYVLQSIAPDTNWSIVYSLSNAGVLTNITAMITNTGFTNLFTSNEVKWANLNITLASNSTLGTTDVLINTLQMYSLARMYIENVDVRFNVVDRGLPILRYTNGDSFTNLLMKRNDTTNFNFVLSNGRTDTTFITEEILLKLNPDYMQGWDYTVTLAGQDISTDITNIGVIIAMSNSIATNLAMTITISADNTNISGITNNIRLQAYSQGREVISTATVQVIKQEPTPDLTVISVSGLGAVGDDIYDDITNQIILGYVIVNKPAKYSVILENDDVIDDIIIIGASGTGLNNPNWTVTIEDDEYEYDVTSDMMSNIITNDLPFHSSKMFIMSISAGDGVAMNETNTIIFLARSLIDTNKIDEIIVHTIRIPVTVTGRVFTRDGKPLDSAIVYLKSMFNSGVVETTTDKDGNYQLLAIPGTYNLEVKRTGYVDHKSVITVKELKVFGLDDVKLLPINLDTTIFDAHSFPNPAKTREQMTLLVNHLNGGLLRVEIVDMRGRILKSFYNEEQAAGVYTIYWDSRDETGKYLEKGVYFLLYYDGIEMKLKKIFMQ